MLDAEGSEKVDTQSVEVVKMREGRRRLTGYMLIAASAMLAGVAAALARVGIPAVWASGAAAVAAAVAGVVTVRGTSALAEADRGRRRLPELVRVDSAGRLPRVRDLDDPVRLGVHPAALGGRDGVVTRVPPFIARDAMPHVHEVLLGSRFLLLVGDSTAGKSRAAFEAVRESLPGYRLVEPVDRQAARAAAEIAAMTPDCVLWLDDLERFLGTGGLNGQAISRVLDSPGLCIIVATMRSEEYTRFTGRGAPDLPDLGGEAIREGEDVLRQASRVDLPRRWSPSELSRAASHGDDHRIGNALRHADRFGLAEYLAAGPQLLADWRAAWAPATHPRGAALVQAAVDARRVGVHRPLPRKLLAGLHQPYLEAHGGQLLRPEPLAAAVAWAITPLHATSSLLLPAAGDRFLAFDYLIDAAEKMPVPAAALGSLISFATGGEATDIGYAAWFSFQFDQAEAAFRGAQAKGHWRAAGAMGDFLYDTVDADRALQYAHETLAERGRELGPDNEQTIWARYDVAFETGRAGQPQAAVRLLEEVLADAIRLFGDDHELARHVSSRIPQWLGDARAAAQMNAELAARYAPAMGDGDSFVIGLRHQHAFWTGKAGDPASAARLAGQLADDIVRAGGRASDLRSARHLEASWTRETGRYADAIRLWEQCAADLLETDGRFTIQSLHTRYELAECHGAAGNATRAREIMQDVMADAAQLKTTRHRDLLICARSLAHWTGRAGDPGEAVLQLQKLIETAAAWRGSQDKYVLGLRWRVADWTAETGNTAGAVHQLKAALIEATDALGADHEITKATQERLQHWNSIIPTTPTS